MFQSSSFHLLFHRPSSHLPSLPTTLCLPTCAPHIPLNRHPRVLYSYGRSIVTAHPSNRPLGPPYSYDYSDGSHLALWLRCIPQVTPLESPYSFGYSYGSLLAIWSRCITPIAPLGPTIPMAAPMGRSLLCGPVAPHKSLLVQIFRSR